MKKKTFVVKHRYVKEGMYMKTPLFAHIELTKKCPLLCSQCYCNFDAEKTGEIKWEECRKIIGEIGDWGVEQILLTGGEPLLYPYIYECLEFIKLKGMISVISSSGYGMSEDVCDRLFSCGLDKIYISLNGSKAIVHNQSRSHYEESIKAIEVIKSKNYFCGINWVARNDNIDDFKELYKLAADKGINEIVILANKKDSSGKVRNELTNDQLEQLVNNIKVLQKESISILIDPCYKSLLQKLYNKSDFTNICSAGRTFFDVLITGEVLPCRHLENIYQPEKYDDLKIWWVESENLKNQRNEQESDKKCQEDII